jgi:hypothetical protein
MEIQPDVCSHYTRLTFRTNTQSHFARTSSFSLATLQDVKTFSHAWFSICHLTCDSFLNAPLGFAQSHERPPDLRHYKTPN